MAGNNPIDLRADGLAVRVTSGESASLVLTCSFARRAMSRRSARVIETEVRRRRRWLATEIEKLLYGNLGVHGVTDFAISPGVIRLSVVPWVGLQVRTIAIFREVRVLSIEAYAVDSGDLDPPWDVIGFDCDNLGGDRWRFVLHCDSIEWCFVSAWPVVEHQDAEPGAASDRGRSAGPGRLLT